MEGSKQASASVRARSACFTTLLGALRVQRTRSAGRKMAIGTTATLGAASVNIIGIELCVKHPIARPKIRQSKALTRSSNCSCTIIRRLSYRVHSRVSQPNLLAVSLLRDVALRAGVAAVAVPTVVVGRAVVVLVVVAPVAKRVSTSRSMLGKNETAHTCCCSGRSARRSR